VDECKPLPPTRSAAAGNLRLDVTDVSLLGRARGGVVEGGAGWPQP
jgi:hypothetical protein